MERLLTSLEEKFPEAVGVWAVTRPGTEGDGRGRALRRRVILIFAG
jgi:hypothetical protein